MISNYVLVCGTWLPFSRYKLHYIVHLESRQQWIRFKNVVLHSAISPSVAGYLQVVRELRIFPDNKQFFDEAGTQPRIGWGKDQDVNAILSRPQFRSIRRVELEYYLHIPLLALRTPSDSLPTSTADIFSIPQTSSSSQSAPSDMRMTYGARFERG